MKKTIYICDSCEKILSNGKIAREHLSICFASYSGWVKKDDFEKWEHEINITGIKQFCNGECLGNYFDKLKIEDEIKKIKNKNS